MYDTITRVPMLVWAPGLFEGGREETALCQQMDIGPTFLELAGAEIDPALEAESILPALRGEPWSGREMVFAEHGRDGILQETESMSMIRTREWKLVHFLGEEFGQLFDLGADRGEVDNLCDRPEAEVQKQSLLAALREWHIRSQCRTSDWAANWH